LAFALRVTASRADPAWPTRVLGGAARAVSLGYALPGAVIAVGILLPVGAVQALWPAAPLGAIVTGTVAGLLYAYLVRFSAVALQSLEAGWLSAEHRPFLAEVESRLHGAGGDYEYLGEIDHERKIAFLRGLDVLSVPTSYRAPKGLYVLEALACGVPVVQPRIGVFPEWIDATGGGLLCEPNDHRDLAHRLAQLMTHPAEADRMGAKGRQRVQTHFNSKRMAERTLAVYENLADNRVRRR
jgi:glycosyltransferase involved in cell wall biosynthesis